MCYLNDTFDKEQNGGRDKNILQHKCHFQYRCIAHTCDNYELIKISFIPSKRKFIKILSFFHLSTILNIYWIILIWSQDQT